MPLVKPVGAPILHIDCNVGDVIVANLAIHIVFFFERRLDVVALRGAFAQALTSYPLFAGRMSNRRGRMRINCEGQGVPFTVASSPHTLDDAIRSTARDSGHWLIDPVNGPVARWGLGALCTVRVTHLADDATAIGFSWHHGVGDMRTAMCFMDAWVAAAAGKPAPEPVIVEERAAYLDAHLPPDGANEPGVRCLGLAEVARSGAYLAKSARRQKALSLYFGDDEIARMRAAYAGPDGWLSANDVVCGHVSEALMNADPDVDRRTLAIAVNVRNRCGLDPMLIGNIITTLNVGLSQQDPARDIARRIRRGVDHFSDRHCDMRTNQRFFDSVGPSRAARCVSTAFDPVRWNPVVSNLSGFGLYRVEFENTPTLYCTFLMKLPVAGLGALLEGQGGRGLAFRMALPPKEFQAMSTPATREYLHRFRLPDDDIPALHR